MTIRTSLLVLAVAGLTACEPPEGPGTTGTPAPAAQPPAAAAPAEPAPSAGGRKLGEGGRNALKAELGTVESAKKAWILSQPGNPEVASLVSELVQTFKEAGWEVQAEQVSGISLKPGIMTLMAEEQYPSYIDTVVKGLEASGLETKSASGYRSYYEQKKAENANWPGIPMRADQDFIIVVGPKATT
jgi:hypothetical protein